MSVEARVLEIAQLYLREARPSGEGNLKAICPFHATGYKVDRTFSINLETGAWICFHAHCLMRGSLVQLMKALGMSTDQIDRLVSEIKPRTQVPEFLRIRAELNKEPVFLPEYILGAFGDTPPKQLLKQGYSEEILRAFEIGFDRHHARITFPIRDYLGRLAAISGRAVDPWVSPKYKVYNARRGGELYGIVDGYLPENRWHLYGFHDIYAERFFIREDSCPPLILVEGYKACLWMRQLGFPHTTALQGSSVTQRQRWLLQRLAGPFYIFLDHQPGKSYPDQKGHWAALQIANALSEIGRTYVCQYPEEKKLNTQPSDLEKEEVLEILEKSKSPTQIYLERSS